MIKKPILIRKKKHLDKRGFSRNLLTKFNIKIIFS